MPQQEPEDGTQAPFAGLPPYPTVSEIVAAIGETATRNLQKLHPHPPGNTKSPDHPA
jgi:hypothetical protein